MPGNTESFFRSWTAFNFDEDDDLAKLGDYATVGFMAQVRLGQARISEHNTAEEDGGRKKYDPADPANSAKTQQPESTAQAQSKCDWDVEASPSKQQQSIESAFRSAKHGSQWRQHENCTYGISN